MGPCLDQSVYLTTLLLGRFILTSIAHNQYCAHSFARNWQLPSLNQRKEENDCRKNHDQSPRKNVTDPAGVEPATSWSQVGRTSEPPRLANLTPVKSIYMLSGFYYWLFSYKVVVPVLFILCMAKKYMCASRCRNAFLHSNTLLTGYISVAANLTSNSFFRENKCPLTMNFQFSTALTMKIRSRSLKSNQFLTSHYI